MVPSTRLYAGVAAAGALALAGPSLGACAAALASTGTAPATSTSPTSTSTSKRPSARERALLDSHELWATIDVCNPANQRNTVGIRGSMPGDGRPHDTLYMSFRLQYMNASKQWVDLSSSASSGFVAVGGGSSARQGGTSFELKPAPHRPANTLRGVVDFQWRRSRRIVLSAAAPTTAGHESLAGADPAGFSAATCAIG